MLNAASSTHASQRDPNFAAEIKTRDGTSCMFTGTPAHVCQAIHLIQRNKGDEYIAFLSKSRSHPSRTPGDEIEDIDDPRNGLFTDPRIHSATSRGEMAIIRTPVPEILASDELHANATANEQLYTVLYLKNIYSPDYTYSIYTHVNQRVPVPEPAASPPHWILDTIFGTVALDTWKVSDDALRDVLSEWQPCVITQGQSGAEEKAARDMVSRNARVQGDATEDATEDSFSLSFNEEGEPILPDRETLQRLPGSVITELIVAINVFGRPPPPPPPVTHILPLATTQRIDNWRDDVEVDIKGIEGIQDIV